MSQRAIISGLLVAAFFIFLVQSVLFSTDTQVIAPNHSLVDFSVTKLRQTINKNPLPEGINKVIVRESADIQPQGFNLIREGNALIIEASDKSGMMYGVLELNERIQHKASLLTINVKQTPYIKKRGLKFNIPLDARNPSYDDTGDSAQNNIETVWDINFWHAYLDRMAEHRYNQLTLWNPQPFTSMLKLDKYPGLALDDIYVSNADLVSKVGVWGEAGGVSDVVLSKLTKVKKITIDEKIDFWKKVFSYAKQRGIEVHLVTWAIYTNSIQGAYGIDEQIENPNTQAFFREAIKEFVLTYKDIKGIGITAGERMPVDGEVDNWSREKWLWQTYGLGLADAKAIDPKRKIDFMHRFWYSGFDDIQKFWGDYTDHFSFSFKYLMARLYSSPEPSHIAERILTLIRENKDAKVWWNLRNDDMFVFRWGNPEYASTLYKNLPMDITEGTHMGSDGYVWAKSFSDKQITDVNYWEIDKHWYRFMLWGRLAYNPDLDKNFFISKLNYKFPSSNATVLYDAWKSASEIVPAVNRYQFQPGDRKFAPESSSSRETFRYVNDFQVARSMPKSGVMNARTYVEEMLKNAGLDNKITPVALADFMQQNADNALSGASILAKKDASLELIQTLDDIRAFAYLGLYYAEKIRAAVALEFYEKDTQQALYAKQAREAIDKAIGHWRMYRQISEKNYHPQMLARVNNLDWTELEKEVEYEKIIVELKLVNTFILPKTNDPTGQLIILYAPRLGGENRHKRMEVYTPDSAEFMVEVYEADGVFINNYHSKGSGAQRWEWFQERRGGTYYLNLKWRDLNRIIKVEL